MNRFNKKPTILVVDDTHEIALFIKNLLNDDYILKFFKSQKNTLDFLKNKPMIDLILLDIMMPETDAYELCSIIKKTPFYASTPIIFLAPLEKTSNIVKGFECGAVDYITKPFIPEVLKARVKTHVELKLLYDKMIDDLHEKEEILFRQSRMMTLGEMFENVTHQWKQPLSIINMSCSIQKINYDFGKLEIDDLMNTLNTVISETEYLSQTIDDFRDFVRNDIEKETFDIKNVFAHTVEILSYRLNKTSIEIHNDIKSFQYRSYKNFIIQIFINILNNAIDIMQRTSEQNWIRAESVIKENEIIIKICDSGGGIKVDDIESIFEKYVTTKDKKEDSGVGLYMCREIMQKKLGGKISVYNGDKGACFELVFPIVYENEDESIHLE